MNPVPSGEQLPRPGEQRGPQLTVRQDGAGLAVQARLEDVVAHGAPAQAVHARQLLARYASEGAGPELDADAGRLVAAYLNDPYLTR